MTEHHRTCHYCEAHCGLVVTTDGDRVTRIRGDVLDPVSKGHLCPKASALKWIHEDPDVVRQPLVRDGSTFREVTWDEAFAEVERLLAPIVQDSGPDAVAVYYGNPASYCLSLSTYSPHLMRLTRSRYSPGPVDTFPKQLANGLMFGGEFTVPVPDIDRTDLLWILGANPLESNGSFMSVPNVRKRLEAIRERGKLVVFDPRRTSTASIATEHHAIAPGTDALFLAAVVQVVLAEGLLRLDHLAELVERLPELTAAVEPFTPEVVAPTCAIPAAEIRRLARELAASPTAAVYGRIGTCTQEFGTLASRLVEVLNVITGNLDRPGGALFSWPSVGAPYTSPGPSRLPRRDRFRSRVSGRPEVFGEFPAGCLSEEIMEPGPGQIRALITVGGNPAVSIPDGRLPAALDHLDALISVDIYVNETTTRAHVILPSEPQLQQPHFASAIQRTMLRQVAKWSEPVFPVDVDRPRDWEIILRLRSLLQGGGVDVDVDAIDDDLFAQEVGRAVRTPGTTVFGRSADELIAMTDGAGPERVSDFLLRTGPYGDAYGADPDGLTLAKVRAEPRGIDLGGLEPHLPGVIRTPSGLIDLAPVDLVDDMTRLRASLERPAPPFRLVGRRDLRTNNSWMHNLPGLARGRDRSRLQIHPVDAERLGLADGDVARVCSNGGTVDVVTEVTEDVMPGVVSLPHGWGQRTPELTVASTLPGVNSNLLGDVDLLDVPSGASVVNGLPVDVVPVGART
jgi:anaerobic selenocysteine-containing dehydrogenase